MRTAPLSWQLCPEPMPQSWSIIWEEVLWQPVTCPISPTGRLAIPSVSIPSKTFLWSGSQLQSLKGGVLPCCYTRSYPVPQTCSALCPGHSGLAALLVRPLRIQCHIKLSPLCLDEQRRGQEKRKNFRENTQGLPSVQTLSAQDVLYLAW